VHQHQSRNGGDDGVCGDSQAQRRAAVGMGIGTWRNEDQDKQDAKERSEYRYTLDPPLPKGEKRQAGTLPRRPARDWRVN
jgi:hypothetical protein